MFCIKKLCDDCFVSDVCHCKNYCNKTWINSTRVVCRFKIIIKVLIYRNNKTVFKFEKSLTILWFYLFVFLQSSFVCKDAEKPNYTEIGKVLSPLQLQIYCQRIMSCNFPTQRKKKWLSDYCIKYTNILNIIIYSYLKMLLDQKKFVDQYNTQHLLSLLEVIYNFYYVLFIYIY